MTSDPTPDTNDSNSIPLYAVETTQPISPISQILGWGFSTTPHTPATPSVPDIPTWMSPDYPFISPSEDIQGLVTDILLSFENPLENIEVPIKLSRITKHSNGVYSARFTDVNDLVVFDSSAYRNTFNSTEVTGSTYIEKATNQSGDCVYKYKTWGDSYELLYWETELITLKMIVRKTTLNQFTIYPDSATLDARALYQYPKRIRSITILNENRWLPEQDLLPPYMIPKYHDVEHITGGSVELWEGYNMQLSWSDNSDLRMSHIITLSAVKGSGAGVAKLQCPEDEPTMLVTSINGVEPTDDGAIFIQSDACHSVKGTDTVKLSNDCEPCCKCEDMSKLGKLINQIEDEYYCIGGKYQVAAGKLLEEISNLEDRIEEEETRGPAVEYEVVEGNRMFLRFRFIFRNRRNVCVSNLSITFSAPNMRIYKGVKSMTFNKTYSECTEIDESATFVSTSVGSTHTITWTGKLAPGQQVYLKGLWKLNTSYNYYNNQLTTVQYYDTGTEQTVTATLGTAGQNHRFPTTGVYSSTITGVFDDYTSSDYISSDDLDDLEEEIRNMCMTDTQPNWRDDPTSQVPLDYLETRNWDAGANNGVGGRITDSDLIDKHTFDPRPDYYPQRRNNSNS